MLFPRSTLTALAAAFVLFTTAAPSSALSEHTRDARRDVASRGLYTDDLPRRPEPARRVGDITAYSTSYGTDLVVTTRFRSLAALGDQDFSWLIRTSDDDFNWFASLSLQAGRDKGNFDLIDPEANQPGCGRAVLDRPARKVTLTVPASCLGNPAWVKVAHGVRVYTSTREYADDARRDGVVKNNWRYGPKLTP
jgi:hypothetical protein